MTKPNEDYLPDQVSEILAKMTPGEQGVMSQFLGRVMQEQERLSKSANSDFLDELKRYLAQYLAALAGMDTGDSDPALDTQFKPGPKGTGRQPAGLEHPESPVTVVRGLAEKLMKSLDVHLAAYRGVAQDTRTLEHNPLGDAVREARRLDAEGTPMRKHDAGAKTSGGDVPQVDLTTDVVASAQAERDRVANQRRG